MSYILSVGTALPEHQVSQAEAAEFSLQHFAGRLAKHSQLMGIFPNTRIETRHFVRPLSWFADDAHTLKERNDIYLDSAVTLSIAASRIALDRAGVRPDEVDFVVFVSTTGLATPSIDARLIAKLGMRPDTKRVPVWGLGCAGGVSGLARASEFVRAYPEALALLIAVETCSVTFQFNDYSKRNFVATSLFADGAAAVVVAGRTVAEGMWTAQGGEPGPVDGRSASGLRPAALEFLGSHSTLFPNSDYVMGWDVVDTGLSVVFAPEIPARIARDMQPVVAEFLGEHCLGPRDLAHYVLHPGGARVLDSYREAFGLCGDELRIAGDVLRECGNMSSPTVLFVLERAMTSQVIRPGDHVLVGALGPGFSSELVLLRGATEP
jgi:alkylresorcinol/alkylpyrone synthase